jgi:putative two-component system protein, hydrogenase maturation factor HypX/HoxX
MRILFLTSAHNCLSQRALVELKDLGHEISVELAVSQDAMTQAAEHRRPDLIVAPMLKKIIPEQVWRKHPCIIVHPGIKGDRGLSSLDWAIQLGVSEWGVTLIEANAEVDAGDIWASNNFAMPESPRSKTSMYRREVTEAAVQGLLETVERYELGSFAPEPLDYSNPSVRGSFRPPMRQCDRAIDWSCEPTSQIARKLRAADTWPGVLDSIAGEDLFLFGGQEDDYLRGHPGEIIARRDGAICRATTDGAVWITHVKRRDTEHAAFFKLPAMDVLKKRLQHVPEMPLAIDESLDRRTHREIWYEESAQVGFLHFAFYNGAMSTEQCNRLRDAFRFARSRKTRVIVMMAGPDFWSNGIDLYRIEAATNAAHESWRNICAIDDLVLDVLTTESHVVVSALQGDAGAGGLMFALAADKVVARTGIVLNPHYKMMGGLFGSEYWTYTLPKRVGKEKARQITDACLPIGTREAMELGMIDDRFGDDVPSFATQVRRFAAELAARPDFGQLLSAKVETRRRDEAKRPLEEYRWEELARMQVSFYGEDRSFHDARRRFVCKLPAGAPPPAKQHAPRDSRSRPHPAT